MTERFPRAAVVLIVAASLVITLAGLRATAGIVGPTLLALVLTITVQPVRRWLAEKNLPDWAVSLIVVVTVYIVLILLTLSLVYAGARMATLLPTYVPQMQENLTAIGDWAADKGFGDAQINAAIDSLDASRLLSLATSLAGAIVALLSNLFFLVTLALFMAFDTRSTERGFAAIRDKRPHLVDALVSFTNGTRSYLAVSAGFGLIVAIIDGVALWIMGVPGAFVWAVLAFVTNFIPNIGFVIGVVPPAIIGLLEGGPGLMIGVIIVYSVINVVIQSVIQPRYVGDKVGLSPTITMLSLVFWAWALGALGALLAVPLSLLARALLVEADPDARWTLPLIAGKPDFRLETVPEELDGPAEAEPAG